MEPARQADAELMARVAAGDEDALAALYERHADAVFRVAFRLVGDRHLAEEVLQETYLALWNRAELFDPSVGSLPAWLLTIARNRSLDRLRAIGRRPLPLPIPAAAGEESQEEALDRLAGGRPVPGGTSAVDPEDLVDAAWLQEAVRGALDRVPDAERTAIELAYYEELTQAESAERLGWPLGTVKTRTRRALARLRTLLADVLGPDLGRRVAPLPAGEHLNAPRRPEVGQEVGRPVDGSR